MNKFIKFARCCAIAAIVYGITFSIIWNIHAPQDMPFFFRGWGGALYLEILLALRLVQGTINMLLRAVVKGTALDLPATAARFLDLVVCAVLMVLALYATAGIRPDLAGCPSEDPLLVFIASVIIGAAVAGGDWLIKGIEGKC